MTEQIDIRLKAGSTASDHTHTEEEISKVGVYALGAVSLAIGVWGLACFAGAVISYGPLGVVKGYFSAIMGL